MAQQGFPVLFVIGVPVAGQLSALAGLINLANRSRVEFIVLMACLTALDALAIDSMLPALEQMSTDLVMIRDNDRQFVVTTIFAGFALGLLVYGVLGDSFGRRRPILGGIVLFLAGTVVCGFAQSLPVLLAGRVLQGIGAAGPYVLSLAIVRDSYEGREMARTLSLVMMIFMTVPALAPIVGQAILLAGSWRLIFLMLAAYSVVVLTWFAIRQPETLPVAGRMSFSVRPILIAARTVVVNKKAMLATVAQGLVMGAFVAFLSTAQQILQQHFALGTQFPFYFALLAISLAIAAFFNSGWVIRVGMTGLIRIALLIVVIASVIFGLAQGVRAEGLGLWGFMIYMLLIYACCGLLFGNLSSVAMSSMGEVAGVASSVIGCISTLLAFVIGALIGSQYEASVTPIVLGFGGCAAVALLLLVGTLDAERRCSPESPLN